MLNVLTVILHNCVNEKIPHRTITLYKLSNSYVYWDQKILHRTITLYKLFNSYVYWDQKIPHRTITLYNLSFNSYVYWDQKIKFLIFLIGKPTSKLLILSEINIH